MLEPTNRTVLTEMLQPPHGFTLSQAVGTTFTLDLASALSVPLSFASRQLNEHDDVSIMAGLTTLAGRISIFAQAGEIYRGIRSDLVALLEDVVHPVQPPSGGLFHPKVWLLEFERPGAGGPDGSNVERRYRFLNLSRNLTEDASWDLSVRLDGVPAAPENNVTTGRERGAPAPRASVAAQALNAPLVALVELLPTLVLRPVPGVRLERLQELATRIATVEWERPDGVEELTFHLLDGSGQPALPHVDATQALIVSPFVSPDGLKELSSGVTGETRLVSRISSIERLPQKLVKRKNLATFVLDDGTGQLPDFETGDTEEDISGTDSSLGESRRPTDGVTALSGLHAKAFFFKTRTSPYRARAFLGSANATSSALHRNVEMMVEIVGSPRQFGPDEILGQLGTLVAPYDAKGGASEDPAEEMRYLVESAIRQLACLDFTVHVLPGNPYSAVIRAEQDVSSQLEKLAEAGITVECHLLTRPTDTAQPITGSSAEAVSIEKLGLHEITPFVQLTATLASNAGTFTHSTIVMATLVGDVENRIDAILARGIGSTESFLQLILLLLDPSGFGEFARTFVAGSGDAQWQANATLSGLFETIMRAVAHDDNALDTVQGIVRQLSKNRHWADDLPDGFTQLWTNVQKMRRKGVRS